MPPKPFSAIPGIRLIGAAKEKAGVLSFLLDNIHPHDTQSLYARDTRWRWAPRDRSGIFDNRAPKCRRHFGISIGGKLLIEFVRTTGVSACRSPRALYFQALTTVRRKCRAAVGCTRLGQLQACKPQSDC